MSKIFNVRLPDAAASPVYDPQKFNQLVRSLEQIVLQLNSTYNSTIDETTSGAQRWFGGAGAGGGFAGGVRGFQLSNGILLPHATIFSTVDQANAGITSENILTYNHIPITNGIRVVDNSKIYVPCAGNYLVTFTLQVTNRSNSTGEFEVWFKDTGVNVPFSNTRFDIPARKSATIWSHIVPAITGIFTITDPINSYLQLAWWSNNINVYIEEYPANTAPDRPEIPSVILTINFISAN